MLDLSALKFQVDTSELEQASKTIATLVQDFSKIDKASQQAARTQAQTEKLLAQAAKEHAQARKANADAAEKELKATITADKADQAREQSIRKTAKATEDQADASKKRVSLLEKEREVTDLMAQGYSRADARFLAMAKSAGAFSDELVQLRETQRAMTTDPFDQSDSSLKRMTRSLHEASQAQDLFTSGSMLNVKQAREMIRDQDRLVLSLQRQGKSTEDISSALQGYRTEYEKVASQLNRASEAENKIIKARQESVNAAKYVTSENERMAAALNQSNSALDKGATDKLVKYESSLRKMGLSQDEVTKKLGVYKTQLQQVQKLEQARAEQFLTRALAPQATDVVVSLWSGQNPLTVLLQQGGQINDLFMQSGIAAEKFGEVVKKSMASMLPSILAVAKGIGGLIVDAFTAAGSKVLNFVGEITKMNGALVAAQNTLNANGWKNLSGLLNFFGSLTLAATATGVAAVAASFVAMGVALKQVISENDKLAVQLGLTGAAMGLSFAAATDMAKGMQNIGVSTSDAMKVLAEMSKQGKLTADDVRLVTKAAIDLQTYGGVAIEDTVKQFVKMREKPVEAMLELSRVTGLVAPEVVKAVMELEEQGRTADATAVAIQELARVNDEQVSRMKESYNGFSLFMIDLGKGISKFFSDAFKDLFYAASPTEQLKKQLAAVNETLDNWGTMNMDIAGVVQAMIPGEKEKVQLQRTQLLNQIALLDLEKQQYEADQKAKQEKIAILGLEQSVTAEIDKRNLKSSKKSDTLESFTSKFIDEKAKEVARSKNLDVEVIKSNEALMKSYKDLAEMEWKSAQGKPKKDPAVNYLATLMREATNATISADGAVQQLTKSQIKLQEVQADPRYQSLSQTDKERVKAIYEQAIATEKSTAAQDLANKVMGKADLLGKQYYATLAEIDAYQKSGAYSPEFAERLRQAAFDQTELAKNRLKIEEESAKVVAKYRDEVEKSSIASTVENAKLDDRLELLGLTSEQAKLLSREQERRNKLLAIDLKLQNQIQEVWEKWGNGDFGVNGATKAQAVILELERQAGEERKNINREVAVQYAEDLDKEFRAIKEGISDSIVTALFEGGKAGSAKLRSVIVNALKQPVTLVVNALVNTLIGSVIGSIAGNVGGSVAASAGSSVGGSILTSAGGSLLGGASSGILGGLSQGFGATMSNGLISGFGVNMGNIGTLLGGGQFSAALGAAAPYLLPAIAILSLLSGLDDSGTYHTGGSAQYSAAGGSKTSSMVGFGTGFGEVVAGQSTMDAMATLSKSLVGIFDGIAKTFGKTAGYEVAASFADDTSEDGAWGGLRVALEGIDVLNWEDFRSSKWAPKEFGDGEEGYKQYLAAVAKDSRQILLDMKLPDWANKILTDLGESASIESLSTAVQQIGVIKAAFDTMKNTLVGLNSASDTTLAALMDLSGGIEALSANATAYYQNFYSAEEQRANVQRQLAASFKDLGLSMIDIDAADARAQFRALVEAQDLNTEAGRKAYATLLSLASAFAGVTQAAEDAATSAEDLRQAYLDSVNAAYDALERAVNAQISILQEQATAAESVVSNLKGIFDLLQKSISDLYGEVTSTSAMQAREGLAIIQNAAASGVLPDQTTLSNAINAARGGITSTDFATQFDADKARLQLAGDLGILLDQTESQLSTAELTLRAIKDQIGILELTLANAKAQVDAINGVNTSVLSVADAVRALQEAIAPSKPTTTPTTGGSSVFSSGPSGTSTPTATYSHVDEIKQYLAEGRSVEPDILRTMRFLRGWTVEEMSQASGISEEDIAKHLGIPAYASGGMYGGGLALVGEEGPELINFSQSGRVYNAADTSSMLSGGSGLAGAIQSLEEKVSNLSYELQAIAINTGKTTRVLERVTRDGEALVTVDVAVAD